MSNQKQWISIIQRKSVSLLFYSYVLSGYHPKYYQEVLALPQGIQNHKFIDGFVIIEANDSDEFNKMLEKKLTSEYLEFFVKQCQKLCENLYSCGSNLRNNYDFTQLSEIDLLIHFCSFTSETIRLIPFLTTIVLVEGVVESKIANSISKQINKSPESPEVKEYISKLVFPIKQPLPSQAIVDMKKICITVNSDDTLNKLFKQKEVPVNVVRNNFPKFYNSLTNYLEKYDFLGTDFYLGSPTDLQTLLNSIKAGLSSTKEDTLEQLENYQKQITEQYKEASKELNLDKDIMKFIKAAQQLHYLRQYRMDAFHKSGRDAIPLFEAIGSKFGLSVEEVVSLTFQEIQEGLLESESPLSLDVINSRMEGYGIILENGRSEIIIDEELKEEVQLYSPEEQGLKELKGSVAYPGVHKGNVVIVHTAEDIEKVNEGDVLVSPMTNPYYLPAMLKAGAIVTDEGGVLSHAAIVSRELQIPCIIGTLHATSAFKNGQEVQVEAKGTTGKVSLSE